jgi:hypothetical protein
MSSKRSIEGKSSEKARRWRKNGEPSASTVREYGFGKNPNGEAVAMEV